MGLMDGKVALVTGAGSGIGRQSALTFAREDCAVVVADLVADAGEETVAMIRDGGGEAIFVPVDVSRSDEVRAMVDRAIEFYGRLDVAVNNAGIAGQPASLHECSEDDWDRIMAVNLKGVWLCLKFEIPPMVAQGSGVIVNVASVVGLVGQPDLTPYVASKHGVIGLTKQAAIEYARFGLRVNAVCPAIVDTPMTKRFTGGNLETLSPVISRYPVGRIAGPQEVAEPIVWLCSEAASYINGHSLVIDGGFIAQ